MIDLYVAPRIRVGKEELTCTVCGETSAWGYCVRCNEEAHGNGENAKRRTLAQHMVPTVSYLRDGEYEVVG